MSTYLITICFSSVYKFIYKFTPFELYGEANPTKLFVSLMELRLFLYNEWVIYVFFKGGSQTLSGYYIHGKYK